MVLNSGKLSLAYACTQRPSDPCGEKTSLNSRDFARGPKYGHQEHFRHFVSREILRMNPV